MGMNEPGVKLQTREIFRLPARVSAHLKLMDANERHGYIAATHRQVATHIAQPRRLRHCVCEWKFTSMHNLFVSRRTSRQRHCCVARWFVFKVTTLSLIDSRYLLQRTAKNARFRIVPWKLELAMMLGWNERWCNSMCLALRVFPSHSNIFALQNSTYRYAAGRATCCYEILNIFGKCKSTLLTCDTPQRHTFSRKYNERWKTPLQAT